MSWEELLRRYLEERRLKGQSPLTLKAIHAALTRWLEFCRIMKLKDPGHTRLAHVHAYLRRLHRSQANEKTRGPLSPATIHTLVSSLRVWFRWAVREGHLLFDPCRDLELHQPPRPLRSVLLPEEVDRLLKMPSPTTPVGRRDRAVLELLYGTGIRAGECSRADLGDLDLAERRLGVRQGKFKKDRLVPFGHQVATALEDYLRRSRPGLATPESPPRLFLNRLGARLRPEAIGVMVRVHSQAAGLMNQGPHALRHAFATHLLEGGARLEEVQALLGHSHCDSTQAYTHLDFLALQKEHRRTHPRARRRKEKKNP